MKLILYLSCLVVLIGNLAWTVRAEGDFDSERARLIEIYGNPNVDKATKESNVNILANFFDNYIDRIELAPELRARYADAVSKFKEEKAKQPLVDGAPPQGGVWSLIIPALISVGVEVATAIVKAVS